MPTVYAYTQNCLEEVLFHLEEEGNFILTTYFFFFLSYLHLTSLKEFRDTDFGNDASNNLTMFEKIKINMN